MNPTIQKPQSADFSRQVLSKLSLGIKHEERFEDLSTDIINGVSNQLVLLEDHNQRKTKLNALMDQIEEARLIRRFHMVYESPVHNKQLNAALNFLSEQFKLRFSKYFS